MPSESSHDSAANRNEILELVESSLAGRGPRLAFPPPLERVYESDTSDQRRKHLFRGGLFAAVVYNLFCVSDSVVVPDILDDMITMRLFVAAPFSAIALLLVALSRSSIVREGACALSILVLEGCLLYPLLASSHPNAVFCHPTILVAPIFSNILLRIRFDFAVASSASLVAGYVWVLSRISLPPQISGFLASTLLSGTIFTLISARWLERELRNSYLLSLRERFRQEHLSRKNIELSELSRIDPLTGLANRRGFDSRLEALHHSEGRACLIMLDVDHFKDFNDRHGHPAGDECLRQIGRMLMEQTREKGDLPSRFGGEEFAVLLADSSLDEARQVAERLCAAARDLELSHAGARLPNVTLSAGVARGRPGSTSQELVAQADDALYRAKREGRDCVRTAEP